MSSMSSAVSSAESSAESSAVSSAKSSPYSSVESPPSYDEVKRSAHQPVPNMAYAAPHAAGVHVGRTEAEKKVLIRNCLRLVLCVGLILPCLGFCGYSTQQNVVSHTVQSVGCCGIREDVGE